MLDPADIHFRDFFEFNVCVTQLHELWIISCTRKQEEEKESIWARLAPIATTNPRLLDYLAEFSSLLATGVGVCTLSFLLVSMPMLPQQRTSAVFSSPQPVNASSATFTSAVAVLASITKAFRRSWCSHRHHEKWIEAEHHYLTIAQAFYWLLGINIVPPPQTSCCPSLSQSLQTSCSPPPSQLDLPSPASLLGGMWADDKESTTTSASALAALVSLATVAKKKRRLRRCCTAQQHEVSDCVY